MSIQLLTLQHGIVIYRRVGMHKAILQGILAHRPQGQHTWKDYCQLTIEKILYVFIVPFMKGDF